MPASKKYAIGIDLGGTKMLIALMKGDHLVNKIKFRTKVDEGEKYFFERLVEGIEEVLSESEVSLKEIAGIGIGCPGLINDHGVILSSPNIPFLKGISLGEKLRKKLHVKVVVENDVNTGLYGEYCLGAAVGHSNVAGIFMGTGIGGAFIFNGKLYRGAIGAAGEVGHVLMDPLGPWCGCGLRGCLEAMAGRLAIAADASALIAKQQAPAFLKETQGSFSEMRSGSFAKAIKAGDRAIERLIQSKAQLVGVTMANIVNLLNPDLIILGGGVVEAMPELILREAKASMAEHTMSELLKAVKVVPAKLGDNAIIMGAAHLVFQKM